VFMPVLKYVHVDYTQQIPFTEHNHDPALAACPNGDVVATWFSTITEPGRESGLVISKLRLSANATAWPPAQLFWHTPQRMDNAPLMWYDPLQGLLFHFHGMAASATWGANAVVMRTSPDCGDTWGEPVIVLPDHALHHQPVNTMFRALDGSIVMPTDNNTAGTGGTALHFSTDNGTTWSDDWNANGEYVLGIHGTLVQLANGTLQAFGRGNDINGTMARSLSADMGATWSYSASPFPGIVGGQRAIQLRLAEGPILFCGFANAPMPITTACGGSRNVTGLFCAASADEGDSWPYFRLVTDDGLGTVLEQLDAVLFLMSATTAEGDGYTVARQGPDGTVHLITSRNHYRFNLAWLMQPPPC
jgi:sulfatase modifying factor 1